MRSLLRAAAAARESRPDARGLSLEPSSAQPSRSAVGAATRGHEALPQIADHESGGVRGAQTADRALRVLELAVDSARPLTLAELCQLSGFNKAVTYRLLRSLVQRGFLAREPSGRGYVVGYRLIGLAAKVMSGLRIREIARPVLVRIAQQSAETVSLYMRHSNQRVCVDVVEGTQPVRRVIPVGETLPLFVGPSGKVILAWLPPDDLSLILTMARAAGCDWKSLEAQLRHVRSRGYLGLIGDRFPGAGGLSVPIFSGAGIVGAVTISGPAERFGMQAIAKLAPRAMRECAEISKALGYFDADARVQDQVTMR